VGDGDKFTNLWKMLHTTTTKLAKQDYTIVAMDVETPVSMTPAIDRNILRLMNAKEGQPAYWRPGDNGLEFQQWVTLAPPLDSRFEATKDRMVAEVAQIANCEERSLAGVEE
jgi:hypothetical protein